MKNQILLFIFSCGLAVSASFAQTTVEPNLILIGRDSLPKNSESITDTLFFVDVEKGALRGGELSSSGDMWSPDSIGTNSFAWGYNVSASGDFVAIALGHSATAPGGFGATAMGRGTTASGYSGAIAMGRGTTASGSNGAIAIGYNTLASGLNGATAMGRGTTASGYSGATAMGFGTHATGNSCIALGSYNDTIVASKTPLGNQSPLFILGNGDFGAPSNALVVQKRGFMGIGSNSPNALLHINASSVGDSTGIQITSDAGTKHSLIYHDALGDLQIRKKAYPTHLVLSRHGNIGVGIIPTSGTNKIEVVGGANCDGAKWNDASDRRLKHHISDLSYGLDAVMALRPVSYRMKSNNASDIGFIAQEVKRIIPEVVHGVEGDVEKGETLSMSYGHLVAALTKGMQEQQKQIEELMSINKELNSRLSSIEAALGTAKVQSYEK